ncbi:putative Cationic amino acid transporter [Operophtera brumata]|uniref:Putative Cationic amino acid transporter n=1 Tax=Operophtera brumata TaxID=104452 RepID=A0A0L7LPT2_OPEBR|nr:putative Cationic amino acid transporter [Operophtera brumata]
MSYLCPGLFPWVDCGPPTEESGNLLRHSRRLRKPRPVDCHSRDYDFADDFSVHYFDSDLTETTKPTNPPEGRVATPPPPNPLDRTTIPPSPRQGRPTGDRNIFEGDGNDGLFGNGNANLYGNSASTTIFGNQYNARTNSTSSHASNRPPWAYPDAPYDSWDD